MNSAAQQKLRQYRIENVKELTPGQWKRFERALEMYPAGPNSSKKIAEYMNCGMHTNHVPEYRYLLKRMKKDKKQTSVTSTSQRTAPAQQAPVQQQEEEEDDEATDVSSQED